MVEHRIIQRIPLKFGRCIAAPGHLRKVLVMILRSIDYVHEKSKRDTEERWVLFFFWLILQNSCGPDLIQPHREKEKEKKRPRKKKGG